jgi:hypothetical protein
MGECGHRSKNKQTSPRSIITFKCGLDGVLSRSQQVLLHFSGGWRQYLGVGGDIFVYAYLACGMYQRCCEVDGDDLVDCPIKN